MEDAGDAEEAGEGGAGEAPTKDDKEWMDSQACRDCKEEQSKPQVRIIWYIQHKIFIFFLSHNQSWQVLELPTR